MQPKTSTTKQSAAEALAELNKQRAEVTKLIADEEKALNGGFDIFKPLAAITPRVERMNKIASARAVLEEVEARIDEYQAAVKVEQTTAKEARIIELRAQYQSQEAATLRATEVYAAEVTKLSEIANQIYGLGGSVNGFAPALIFQVPGYLEAWCKNIAAYRTPEQKLKERDDQMNREFQRRIEYWREAMASDKPLTWRTVRDRRGVAEDSVLAWAMCMERTTGKRPNLPLGISWPKPPELEESDERGFALA